jgi:hypothetical protein
MLVALKIEMHITLVTIAIGMIRNNRINKKIILNPPPNLRHQRSH